MFFMILLLLFFFHVLQLPELQVAFEKIVRKTNRVNYSRVFWLVCFFSFLFSKVLFPIVIGYRFFHNNLNNFIFNKREDLFRLEIFTNKIVKQPKDFVEDLSNGYLLKKTRKKKEKKFSWFVD